MFEFSKFVDAEKKANEISKEKKVSVSIIKRCCKHNFIVIEKGSERKANDVFITSITNYSTRFRVRSHSPKSGEHTDYFATEKRMRDYVERLKKENYRTNISYNFLGLDTYRKECVIPYLSSKKISEKYLESLREK